MLLVFITMIIEHFFRSYSYYWHYYQYDYDLFGSLLLSLLFDNSDTGCAAAGATGAKQVLRERSRRVGAPDMIYVYIYIYIYI